VTADRSGRVVIVTGGNRGVGLGIAQRFREEGDNVVTCSRSPYEPPAEFAEQSLHVACDVRDYAQIEGVVQAAEERWGRIDVLINNAGGSPVAPFAGTSPRFHKSIVEINLVGPMWFSLAVQPVMAAQETGGAIVNISSMASMLPSGGLTAYGAAKAGLNHLTRSLAVDWGPQIRVNCIALGAIETEAMASELFGDNDRLRQKMADATPLRRIGSVEEIAETCVFLVSGKADYIDGATIWADGGGVGVS
jgi:NAD(P)-dependent dehydrogenase (short-subunit alcohol dehydrogenase family)